MATLLDAKPEAWKFSRRIASMFLTAATRGIGYTLSFRFTERLTVGHQGDFLNWLSRSSIVFAVLTAALLGAACSKPRAAQESSNAAQPPAAPSSRPTIVFMTDFGTANDAVAICQAVISGISPEARLTDITHQVTPFQIDEAARVIDGVPPDNTAITILMLVVDHSDCTERQNNGWT